MLPLLVVYFWLVKSKKRQRNGQEGLFILRRVETLTLPIILKIVSFASQTVLSIQYGSVKAFGANQSVCNTDPLNKS